MTLTTPNLRAFREQAERREAETRERLRTLLDAEPVTYSGHWDHGAPCRCQTPNPEQGA
jgi:hypothetical protein